MAIFDFKSGGLSKNILFIATGSILIQVITAVTLPLVTRLYGPEVFGYLSILISSVSILASIGALSIDLTIPLPNSDDLARENLEVASSVVLGMGTLAFIFTYPVIVISGIFAGSISNLSIILCYPLLIMQVISSATILFLTRLKDFKRIQITLVAAQVIQVLIHILVGLNYPKLENLLLGYLISLIVSTVLMMTGPPAFANPSTVKRTLFHYRGYVTLTSLGSLINVISSQAPMLLVAFFVSIRGAAYIAMVNLIIGRPLSLISQSSSQGLLGEWSSGINKNSFEIRQQALRASFKILILGTLVMTCAILFFSLFPTAILGSEWNDLWKYLMFYGLAHVVSAAVNPLAWLPELFGRTDLTLFRSLWRLAINASVAIPICFFLSSDSGILLGLCLASTAGSFIFGKICLSTISVPKD